MWEIGGFYDDNTGLVLAESGREGEEHPFLRLPWLGEQVFVDRHSDTAALCSHPFKEWKNQA